MDNFFVFNAFSSILAKPHLFNFRRSKDFGLHKTWNSSYSGKSIADVGSFSWYVNIGGLMNLISRLLLFLLIVGFLGTLGCTYSANADSSNADSELQETAGMASNETGNQLSVSGQTMGIETVNCAVHIKNSTVNIKSENRTYKAYTAAPAAKGNYPTIVLIHSFKGFEPGYKKMVDRMAADGYVVIAPFWQTYSNSPSDAEVEALVRNSIAYLDKRGDVNSDKLGLTGFCAGGRYTMLFLPQIKEFKTGVAGTVFLIPADLKSSQTSRSD